MDPPLWAGAWLVPAAAVLVYLNSLGNGFALDDLVILVGNGVVHDLSRPLEILLSPYWPGTDALDRGLYRPFTSLAFGVQWVLGDGSPLPFHVVNVALHAGTSTLVYALLRRLVGWAGAWAGGLIFAVHPVHVEAVANGVGQAELWSALFVLSAALVYAGRPSSPLSGPRAIAVALLYAVAMLSKEHAIVLPALLLALDRGTGRLHGFGDVRRWAAFAALLTGVAANYLLLRWIVLDGALSGRAAMDLPGLWDPKVRLLTALSVWPEYGRLLFFPAELSATYDPAMLVLRDSLGPPVVAGGLILAAGSAAMLLPGAWPGWGLGFAWFLFSILPVSNLILPVGTLLGERTLYLPSVAVAIWIGFGVTWFLTGGADREAAGAATRRRRGLAMAALGLLVLLFSIRVVTRNPVWRSNEALFAVTLRDHPESFRAHWFEALRAARAGDTLASAASWRRARSIYDGSSTFLTQYSAFQRSRGETAEAVLLADEALRLRPGSPTALYYRALLDGDLGRPEEGVGRAERLDELGYPGLARRLRDSLAAGAPPGP